MSLTLTIDNITGTTARLNYAALTGGPTLIEVQVSPRDDFAFCACPIFTTVTATPVTISGLNQAQTYFARARGVTGAGVRLDWSATEPFRTPLVSAPSLVAPATFLDPAMIVIPERLFNLENLSTAVAGYGVANLLDDGPSAFVSEGTGAGNAFHNFVFRHAGAAIDTIALLNCTFSEAAIVSIHRGTTKAIAVAETNLVFTGQARASANIPGRMAYHGLWRFADVTNQWIKVKIETAAPGARHQAGHLVAGKSIISKRIARDMGTSLEDLGIMERNLYGIPDRQSGLRTRVVDFDLAMLDETIYETQYAPLHDLVGNTEPVLIVPNPKASAYLHDRILYGTLSGGRVSNPISKYHTRRFQINSII